MAEALKAEPGHVYVEVSGLTGTGKSAVMGEIEIAMKALGLPVHHDADFQTEKNGTHADWQEALDLYKPTVVLREVNVSRASPIPPADMREQVARIIEDLIMNAARISVGGDRSSVAGRVASGLECAALRDPAIDAILALAPPAVGVAEPVAWRYRFVTSVQRDWSDWFIVDDEPSIPELAADDVQVQPLFAHPQPSPDGEVERLREALDKCSAALQRLHTDVEALMADSEGVAGLHHNGEVATWEELSQGGRFSDWIGDPLWAARNAWQDARQALSTGGQS
jgi:hypothetical protein